MIDAALLSDRRVSTFSDGERLVLWALRHRVATGDPASPHLAHAFGVLCGSERGPRAHAALNDFVAALDVHARRPLAFLDWCNRAVTTDEACALDAMGALQAGLPARPHLRRLVFAEGEPVSRAAIRTLIAQLGAAGLRLPTPVSRRVSSRTADDGPPTRWRH